MCRSNNWPVLICTAVVAAFSVISGTMVYPEEAVVAPILKFLAVGQRGDNPIGLRAWYDKEPGHAFQSGDRVIILFQTDGDGYVTMLNVAPDRSVQVLFPNIQYPDAAVRKGRVYTLFGDDSRLRLSLGKKVDKGHLIVCVSSKPFDLAPLKPKRDQLGIALDSHSEFQVLREKMRNISQDAGFNRVVLPFNEGEEYGFETELTTAPESGPPAKKKLPGGVESEQPGTLTGSQGLRPQKEVK